MTALNRVRIIAEGYFAEILSTVAIRQSYNDLIVSQASSLFAAFSHDATTKSKLSLALRHKDADASSLYRALVLQANGVFEQYIRGFVAAVAEKKCEGVAKYIDLGEQFRMEYVHSAANVLACIKKGNIQGQDYDFSGLLESLGMCISGNPKFHIKSDVFTILLGNCTADRLEKLFSVLELPEPFSPQVGDNKKLKACMKEQRRVQVAKMTKDELDRQIVLRNRIAHGDMQPSITSGDVQETVAFFSALIDVFDEFANR